MARGGGERPQICAEQVPSEALSSLTDVTGARGSMNIWKTRLVNLTHDCMSVKEEQENNQNKGRVTSLCAADVMTMLVLYITKCVFS